jgi:hypothetical protein
MKKPKHFIVLWLGGGPSHMDLWDIKVGSQNQGDFQPIDTAVPGIKIGELMENTAKEFKNLSIVRTLDSRDGDITRATYRMNHVLPPSPLGVSIPGVGAVVSHFCGSPLVALPRCMTIEGSTGFGDAGFLPVSMAGFPVSNPGTIPENLAMPNLGDPATTKQRGELRGDLLKLLDGNYADEQKGELSKDAAAKNAAQRLRELHERALELSRISPQIFQFNEVENKKLQERFGQGGFGRGCLLAAKLVQAGVTAIQVTRGGWDMHGNIANAIVPAARELDKGFAGLMAELRETELIKDTVVLCAGPFGRTPKINQGGGRDKWAKGWSVVLGGCGIGGVEYGKMDKDGLEIVENPVSVEQLYATIYTALGIDLTKPESDLRDNLGRRFYIAGEKENAQPIKELLKPA